MLGLALEGGGAKGAFHIGAVKAFLENGYKFDGIVGTSIGAYNAAIIAQGDFEVAYELWYNLEPSTLFDVEDEYIQRLMKNEISRDTLKYISGMAKSLVENRGIDTAKLRDILEATVDEAKLRSSKVDFGMVTVSIPDFSPVKVYIEDINEGKVIDYIMASASLPGFKLKPVEGKYYIDGGVHDNCPVSLLLKKGYEKVIAVRTSGANKFWRPYKKHENIINIFPSEPLGSIIMFDNDIVRRNITLGYYDALKVIRGLKGTRYYIEPSDEGKFFEILQKIPDETIFHIADTLKLPTMEAKRLLFEKIVPALAHLLKLPPSATYEDIFIGLLEVIAKQKGVEKYKIYTLPSFIEAIEYTSPTQVDSIEVQTHLLNLKKAALEMLGANILDEIAYVILDNVYTEIIDPNNITK